MAADAVKRCRTRTQICTEKP
uniref:Uncharacterized protein n=1 Tax=Anguilla anguilla TaxID=7936 RepID=A0A0E9SVA8_ANGAN